MRDPIALAGHVLDDKYAIDHVVGEGGFSTVYRAMHLRIKRPVAIKVFHAAAQFTDQQREKLVNGFVQEAGLLADLSERQALRSGIPRLRIACHGHVATLSGRRAIQKVSQLGTRHTDVMTRRDSSTAPIPPAELSLELPRTF